MLQFGVGVFVLVMLAGLLLPVRRKAEKVAVEKTVENTDNPFSEALECLEDVGYSDEET